jgi:hypothetical protein
MSIANLFNSNSAKSSYMNLSSNTLAGSELAFSVSTTTSVSAQASGSLFSIPSAASAFNMTFPSASIGFNCKVVQATSSLANAVTLVFPSGSLSCSAIAGDATAVGGTGFTAGLATGKTNLILGTGGKVGDIFEVYSPDGTNYYVNARINVHTTITAT